MAYLEDIPRKPARDLSPTDIEVELAGIKASLEMGGLTFTEEAEEAARGVLTGEMSEEDAVQQVIAKTLRRHGQ